MLITKHDIIIYISIIENLSGMTMMIMIPLTILDKVIIITGYTIKKKKSFANKSNCDYLSLDAKTRY